MALSLEPPTDSRPRRGARSAGVPVAWTADRPAPQAADAEAGLLASLMLDGGTLLARCRSRGLTAPDFFNASHQTIFATMLALDDAGGALDEISLCDALANAGELENVGGVHAISELARRVEVTAHALHWCDIVLEKSRRRKLIAVAARLVEHAFDPTKPLAALASRGVTEIVGIERNQAEGEESFGAVVGKVEEKWRRALAGEPPPFRRTVSWGLPELDEHFTPLCAEQGDGLVIVAARSGVGKSSLARQMVHHLLKTDPEAIAQVFLLETQAQQLAARMAGLESGIPYNESLDSRLLGKWRESRRAAMRPTADFPIGSGEPLEHYQRRAEEARFARGAATHSTWVDWLKGIADKRLFVRAHTYDCDAICAQARAIHRLTGRTDLLVIDYLQIVDLVDSDGRQGYEVIKHLAMRFKQLAKDIGCPVLVIASVTVDGDGIPGLEDLRGSKDAGYAADRVVVIHRPTKDATGADQSDDRALVHVNVRQVKARDAGVHTLWAGFVRALTKYVPLERHYAASSASSTGETRGRGRPLGVKDSAPRAPYGSRKEEPRRQSSFVGHEDPPASAIFDNN